MVIKETLANAIKSLKEISDTPSLDAKILLEKACSCDRLFLLKKRDDILPDESIAKFNNYIERRIKGEPVAYIVGSKEFMGLNFIVTSDVLIPRPDTETLAEYVISNLSGKILDIGTGSGCIAISCAKFIKGSEVTAIDKDAKALSIASKNADMHNVSIKFICLDILKNDIEEKYNVILSNPPYIKTETIDGLSESVKDYEPKAALDGGGDGLIFYRAITKKAAEALLPKGVLAFEIGYDQADEVSSIMEPYFDLITVLKDLSGNDRVVSGILK
ncbi:MAG: peptide chain release factor N(5)-glutamine methyltransferase [Bacillota bacterium]|nr:peptide chain release factor N(5)-glutamine methyltransferase [Bacillota bacterium]